MTFKESTVKHYKNIYFLSELKRGYDYQHVMDMFEHYPENVFNNIDLISKYIVDMPFCKYLEEFDGQLYIKLDGTSKYEDLNRLSKILRGCIDFSNCTLVFSSSAVLKYILRDGFAVHLGSRDWKILIQSAFSELYAILEIYYAISHIMSERILNEIKGYTCCREVELIFEMFDNNAILKAFDVNIILFGTYYIFGQKLNENVEFVEYMNEIIKDRSFLNIEDTLGLQKMKDNIIAIKLFVNSLDISEDKVREYLETFLTIQVAFHINMMELGKLVYTDLIDPNYFSQRFYQIITNSASFNKNIDIDIYAPSRYINEVKTFIDRLYHNKRYTYSI